MSVLAPDTAVRPERAPDRAAGHRALLATAAFFAVAVVIHNGDHLRRGVDAVGRDVFALGTAGIFLEVAVVVLICQRHRLAPLAAAVTGFTLAAGYITVHFTPGRSWASDSFVSGGNVSPLSLVAASLEVAAAVTLAVVGLSVLRRRGGLEAVAQPNPEERSLREGLLHPLAFVFLVSQVVTLAVSFAQL